MKIKTFLAKTRQLLSRIELYQVVFLLVVLIFIGVLAGNLPPPAVAAQANPATPTPEAVETLEFSRTPIPSEYLSTDNQTNGIILGSVILVLIVIGSTLSVMLRKDDRQR